VTELDLETLRLTWTPPSVPFDGYMLEGSIDGGPFVQINNDLIPASLSTVVVGFTQHIPELLHLEFRLSSVVGGKTSGSPADASYTEPLRTPTVFAGASPGGIEVGLSSDSQLANHFHLERLDGRVTLDLPIGEGVHWSDQNVEEDTPYTYRVTVSDGVHSSNPATSPAVTLPVIAPIDVTARSTEAGHIVLTWTNRSHKATDCVILRWPGVPETNSGELAHLSPDADRFDDAVPAPGVYGYQLVLSAPGAATTALSPAAVGVTAPSGDIPMSARVLPLPSRSAFAPDGALFTAEQDAGPFSSGGPWFLTAPSGEILQGAPDQEFHGFVVDGRGSVHTLLLGTGDELDSGVVLEHVWFDGSRWRRQPVGSAPILQGAFFPLLDLSFSPSGLMRVAWGYAGMNPGLTLLEEQADGGFQVTQPDSVVGPLLAGPRLVMGQESTHLLYSAFGGTAQPTVIYELSRDATQAWTATGLSIASPNPVYSLDAVGLVDGGFGAAFIAVTPQNAIEFNLSQWTHPGWDSPEPVGDPGTGFELSLPDLISNFRTSEVTVATPDALFDRRNESIWARNAMPPVLGPPPDGAYVLPSQIGYFQDAGLYVLVPVDSSHVALFVEER
jgi:hypothetical protein